MFLVAMRETSEKSIDYDIELRHGGRGYAIVESEGYDNS